MVKNKNHLKPSGGRKRVIAILSVLFTITASSLGALKWLQGANALPGAPYRYSAASCSSGDSECYKYSAQAGAFRAYRGVLNRNPDSGGFSFWSGRLQSGADSLRSVAQNLLSQSEWQNKYSGITNEQFVNNTYQFALKRNPDTNGYNFWVGQLNSGGRSKSEMVSEFIGGNESANAWHSNFIAYYSPAPPPPPPPPPPTAPPAAPNPTPTRPPSPSTNTRPSTPIAPRQPPASPTGLQITDFAITELNYRSALLTWKTNKPATTKANYSTNKDDLSTEQKNDAPVTDHVLKLEGDGLKAGKHYFVRITSSDGGQPVTIDGEFDTKPISVIIKVTDQSDQPVEEAEVTVLDVVQTTDTNGETTFALPEGEVKIFAKKDDLSREINGQIDVPTDEANPQRITLALGETTEAAIASSNGSGSNLWKIVLGIFVFILLSVGGFIFWRKRRQANDYTSDPLEAENYTSLPPPDLPPLPPPGETSAPDSSPTLEVPPPPPLQPVEDPLVPHHTTLPELVREVDPVNESQPGLPPISPTGQPIPTHTSLADLVENPVHKTDSAQAPPVNDLPVAPLPDNLPLPPEMPMPPQDSGATSESEDGSLTIEHKG